MGPWDDRIEPLVTQAIEDPSPQSSLVLADALQEQGDPRGELILLQHADDTERARSLIDAHLEHLAGFVPGPRVTLEWRLGFVEQITIGAGATPEHRRAALEAVGTRPAARGVRRLVLAEPRTAWGIPTNLLHDLFRSLLSAEITLPGVTSVRFGNRSETDPYHQVYSDFELLEADEDLSPLWSLFPGLTELTLDLGHAALRLGTPRTDALRRFTWASPFLRDDDIDQFQALHTPNLEHFEVWTGCYRSVNEAYEVNDEGFDETRGEGLLRSQHLAPLLAHVDTLEHLRRFGLVNFAGAWGELAAQLAVHPAFARIETLDVSRGRLGEDEVEPFAAACREMGRLKRVIAHALFTDEESWARLRTALGGIDLEGSQSWTPSQYCYVSAME